MATPASEHIALSDNDALFYDREFLTSVLTIIGKMCQIIAMGPRSLESPEGSFAFSVWQNSYYIQSVLLGLGSGYSIQDLSRQILPNLNALVDITILPDPALNTESLQKLRALYQICQGSQSFRFDHMRQFLVLEGPDHHRVIEALYDVSRHLASLPDTDSNPEQVTEITTQVKYPPVPWIGDWASKALETFTFCRIPNCTMHENRKGLVMLSAHSQYDNRGEEDYKCLDFFFYTRDIPVWDEVHLYRSEVQNKTVGDKTRFDETCKTQPPRKSLPKWCRKQPRQLESLCRILGKPHVASHKSFNLMLDDGGDLWLHEPTNRRIPPDSLKSYVPLVHLIKYKHEEWGSISKRIVAVILSYTLYHYYGKSLLGKRWPKDDIMFFKTKDGINLTPYLNVRARKSAVDQDGGDSEENDALVWYPLLVGFAITLLELHTGQSLESSLGIPRTLSTIEEQWTQASVLFDREEIKIEGDGYRNAIRSCLNTTFESEDREDTAPVSEGSSPIERGSQSPASERSDNNDEIRERFYKKVIVRLEAEILHDLRLKSINELEEKARDASIVIKDSNNASESLKPILDQDAQGIIQASLTKLVKKRRRRSSMTSPEKMTTRVSLRKRQKEGRTYSLFKQPDQQVTAPDADIKTTAQWIKDYKNTQHLIRVRKLSNDSNDRVKIAILDTGIDMNHDLINFEQDRVKQIWSWVDSAEGKEARDCGDFSGHGTYIADIVLSLAPNADIYIAKITETNIIDSVHASRIATAIDKAFKEWGVDIINCSFGFDDGFSNPEIIEAVENAVNGGCLVFVAASNDGHKGRAFPATMPRVFGIHSTDGLGNSSKFNPESDLDDDNFSILGEYIEAAWANVVDHTGAVTRLCGTSYASPVAATVAARILDWALQNNFPGTTSVQYSLKSYEGMKRVFQLMAGHQTAGYKNIWPAKLFGRGLNPAEKIREVLAPTRH